MPLNLLKMGVGPPIPEGRHALLCKENVRPWPPGRMALRGWDCLADVSLLLRATFMPTDPSAEPFPDLPPPLVRITGVTKTYGGKTALREVNLTIPAGQICGLLGPNGAGKTTLFRLLMGILKTSAGVLLVDGLDAFEDRVEVKRLVGFLPDEPVFHSYLSGREVLELSGGLHGLTIREITDRMMPLIQRLDMVDAMNLFAEDYSRGMKKKLGIMLALLHRPKLLILDEPTNGLDVESTRLFYDLMHEQSQAGTTIVFSTHLMDHVTRLCTHAAVLRDGRIVASGRIAELCAGPHGPRPLEEVFVELTSSGKPPERDSIGDMATIPSA